MFDGSLGHAPLIYVPPLLVQVEVERQMLHGQTSQFEFENMCNDTRVIKDEVRFGEIDTYPRAFALPLQ